MIYAAIFASGRGTRIGGDLPKQFYCVDGEPVIVKCVSHFLAVPEIDKVIAAVPADYIDYTKKLFREYGIDNVTLIAGGSSRNGTLLAFLDSIRENEDDIILTHDAARPFVSEKLISACIESMKHAEASTVALPVVDSVIYSDGSGHIETNLDRNRVYLVQTPQTFRLARLRENVGKLAEGELEKMTDCSAIYRRLGLPVSIVPGEKKNIKITWPEDLEKHNA